MILEKLVSLYTGLYKGHLAGSLQVPNLGQEVKLLKSAIHITFLKGKRKAYDIGRHIDRVKDALRDSRGLSTEDII
jgi:hypothetical protein